MCYRAMCGYVTVLACRTKKATNTTIDGLKPVSGLQIAIKP